MTVINNNYLKSGYYQLGSQQNTATPSAPTTLSQALDQVDQSSGFASSAYQLNLSANASSYLSSLLSANPSTSNPAAINNSVPDNFVLTKEQQTELAAIIEKYKDAPQTQETFNQIQDDLKKAGLDPDRLAAKEQAASFNPTAVLISILSGNASTDTNPTDPKDIAAQYDAQKSNYLKKITSIWQSISTTGSAVTDQAATTPAG
jgi:hypothetical protein